MDESQGFQLQTTDPNSPDSLEEQDVSRWMKRYKTVEKFEEQTHKRYVLDRAWAAGEAVTDWAVDANLIGSYIDILVAYIYARNPDASIRPEKQVQIPNPQSLLIPPPNPLQPDPEKDRQLLAETLELVVSRLWKDGKLKSAMQKVVRSGFTIGIGWWKSIMLYETETDAEIKTQINDAQDNLARIRALQTELAEGEVEADGESRALKERELEDQIKGLEANLEVIVRHTLAIDFFRGENIKVSLDVEFIGDYCEARWIANDIYIERDELRAKFPRLGAEDAKKATAYYQRDPKPEHGSGVTSENAKAEQASAYTKTQPGTVMEGGDGKPVEFCKVVEFWCREDNMIRTAIDGVKRWAKEPRPPKKATSRFYPFFAVIFFPLDGKRHPQSLSARLMKLQDEYSSSRSSYRLMRKRSIPGTFVNGRVVDATQMQKIQRSEHQEFIALDVVEDNVDMRTLFAEKPVPTIDPRLFDNSMVIGDMEKISGVQEALQTSDTVEKTATQAEIEQGGFAARTTAERDAVEDPLTEFAQYTAELALQCLSYEQVAKIAGQAAFWPKGKGAQGEPIEMDLDDVTSLLNIDIEAGSTGRPNTAAEREAWANALPILRETMLQIREARLGGDEGTAKALEELLRETFARLGDDRLDVDRFIPSTILLNNPALAAGAGSTPNGAAPANTTPAGPAGPQPVAPTSQAA